MLTAHGHPALRGGGQFQPVSACPSFARKGSFHSQAGNPADGGIGLLPREPWTVKKKSHPHERIRIGRWFWRFETAVRLVRQPSRWLPQSPVVPYADSLNCRIR